MSTIKEKVAVITGASEGIGKEICFQMAANNYKLALVARTEVKLKELSSELAKKGYQTLIVPGDVTKPEQVKRLFHQIIENFGRIDILINNAGRGLRKPLVYTTDDDWSQVINLNLSSVFYCCREVLPIMRKQKYGHIINIASRSGRIGEGELAAYSAAKHGVVGLTQAMAREESSNGIILNVICPGPVATDRMRSILPEVDKSNWLTPQDVATMVLYLININKSCLQGQSIDLFSVPREV